ncbi:hypothetical protein C8A05DRAFT_11696 [Staphylotrichum tortipilum]|uniref:Uncharacterized protein n=1 Tax=Staphylotrichum tortipilum TaxID=2831512 RepID=A0AAN6MT19_9PEZI|nr:hypothetical protein C8A05DRAFT_11696 [Staphylotrichum longicolle]
MVERDDIDLLLKTGSWRTARSRSPHPYDSHRRPHELPRPNTSASRTAEPASRTKRPPPPCVEDEEESLAKEHVGSVVSATSDEEPKHRGDIDQHPILLPVHEHNPERRFVLVPGAAEEDALKTNQARYEANTCRKYVLVDEENGDHNKEDKEGRGDKPDKGDRGDRRKHDPRKETSARLETPASPKEGRDIPKRRSHQDLPRLSTDFENAEPSIRRSNSRRDRERPLVHQDPQDRPSSRDKSSSKPPDSAFLSPAAVKLSTGRRERAYSDARSDSGGRSGRSPSARRDTDVEVSGGGRRSHHSSKYSAGGTHRRASSTTNVPARSGPPDERTGPFLNPHGYGDPDEILAYMAPGEDFKVGKSARDISPPRRARRSKSPPHPRGAREMPGASPTRRRHPRPPTRDRDGYSSDDSYSGTRSSRAERAHPRRPTLDSDYPSRRSPDQTRRPNPRLGDVVLPLGAAALAAQFTDDLPQPSSRSATFPPESNKKGRERSLSPSPATSASPSRRPARGNKAAQAGGGHARDESVGSGSNGSPSIPPSVVGSLPRAGILDRPPTLPPVMATPARHDSPDPHSSMSSRQHNRDIEQSDEVNEVTSRALSRLPDCRWKHPALARHRVGSEHLLTLKRAENFTICSRCFGALFANTEFHHLFVQANIRSGDQVVACDFGASPWYRIAYILTLNQRYPDLRLLQGIASVAARSQACAGSQAVSRTWYSVIAPGSRRPVQSFNICHGCAKMVEVLLPNLAGVFVPLDLQEPTKGICELHFAPERKRFFDYFDQMRATSAVALSRRTTPSLADLVDRIREISLHEECLRNTPIPGRKWHILQLVPEFTVCEECFNAVVWPMIEDEESGSEVPRNFYRTKQPKQVASCQLYSERMRGIFMEACKYDDFDFLTTCVHARLRKLAEIKARYNELQREDQEAPEVRDELALLSREFKAVE